ncbi:MATE family efflux transporter [Butyrivibrio sp. AE3004]|uniref:MATE family efflux transporter n=1 Tax=Butyrivibrio sp. AE3004 TaxID=1506994 RepID=UPI0018CC2693|nr:MATE family efflux transporter [Butyrivibrio sp. AE3004]
MKQIILFFLPLLWGNLFQQLYSLVDSIIVGKGISDQALAAVGATGTLNFLILGFVVGMTRGFGISFAQSFGKDDMTLLNAYIRAAKKLSITFGIIFTIVCVSLLNMMLSFMKTPDDIFEDAYKYFIVILLGIVVTVMNNLEITILQSLGDSKTPLTAMISSSLVNIMLDIILIMAFNTGVAGAAVATVVSQFISYLLCLKKIKNIGFLNLGKEAKEPLALSFELMRIGIPVALMNSVTAVGAMILQYFVNLMGSAYVAAYSACMKFASLFEQFGMSVGLSMMTFVGQNKGAGKIDRIRLGVRQGILISTVVNLPISMLMIFFPGTLARMLLTDNTIIDYCTDFMPIMGISFLALGWLFVYRYSVQGLGNTFIPMLSGGLEVIMRLAFGFSVGRKGFRGIAVSEVSAWIAAFIMLMVTYYVLINQKSKGRS